MGNQAPVLNGFNRVVAILLAWSVLGIAALYARDPASTIAIVQGYLDPLRFGGSTVLLGAIAISALAFLVLLVEIWPGNRRTAFEVRIESGVVEYEARVLVGAISHDLATLDGARVHGVDVSGSGNRVRVKVRIEPTQNGDPSAVAALVSNRVRDTVKQLGLEVQSIRLSMEAEGEPRPLNVKQQAQPAA